MRPSKLRLPDSTAHTVRSRSAIAREISSGSGPELPMQVVQPYPTSENPSRSSGSISPARSRYSVTTFEPGARLVFTHAGRVSPASTAFLASRPAPSMTEGFDVFVQLVIAAITTAPWSSPSRRPDVAGAPSPRCAGMGLGDTPAALLDGGSLAGKVMAAEPSHPS